jgi:hypothetical protein
MGNVSHGLHHRRPRYGGAPALRCRRVAHEDGEGQVDIYVEERQRVGAGVTRTEHNLPCGDALGPQKTHELRSGAKYELGKIEALCHRIIGWLLHEQPGLELTDLVVVKKIVIAVEMHDSAASFGSRQQRGEQ